MPHNDKGDLGQIGSAGRRHGDPPPRSSDATHRIEQKERNRKRSRAEALRAPDIEDLTGQGPDVLPDDLPGASEHVPPEVIATIEEAAERHVNALDEQMREQGLGLAPWNSDVATEREYFGEPRGLPDHMKRDEIERLSKPFKFMSRSDFQGLSTRQAFVDELWADWRDVYGGDFTKEEVAAAAQRVAKGYELDGSLNVARKSQNRGMPSSMTYTAR